ncbi:MAG: hypothetical protein ACR2F2_10780 [Pyrinomonadaceae bacterium]
MDYQIENWQAEVLGQIYETNISEMSQWITEGALLPTDKVRRGNLRWLEAGKIPLLLPFFNAKEHGIEPPPIQTNYTTAENTKKENYSETQNFTPLSVNLSQTENNNSDQNDFAPQFEKKSNLPVSDRCVLHPENESKFHCETCGSAFCPQCPKSYGGNVKICPMCGAMCKKIGEVDVKKEKEIKYRQAVGEGFGIQDIALSFAHPFKFTASLIIGAIMYMFLTIGQNALAFGGISMIFGALVCFMLANMLAFGIMANTIENFSQGKLEKNFMPDFEDFNLWDDVVHPFFLTIGIYLSSFGPLLLVVAVGIFVVINTIKTNTEFNQTPGLQTNSPFMIDEQKSLNQSDEVKKLTAGIKTEAERKRAITENGLDESQFGNTPNEDVEFSNLNEMIQQNRKAELEAVVGKTPETKEKEFDAMYSKLKEQGIVIFLLGLVALLWGIFYVPAACAVAGYTRSFSAALNPTYGIDFIKRIGVDYLKILGVYIAMLVAGLVFSTILQLVLYPFNLPGMGNIPATAIASFYTFFVTIVLACILGRAVLKNSEKLGLYQG